MKKINIEKAIKAYQAIEDKKCDLDTINYLNKNNPGRFDPEPAKKAVQEAKEAFQAICEKTIIPALKEAEGRATARTVTCENIIEDVQTIVKELRIAQSRLEGSSVILNHNAQTFPKAYKYTPEATLLDISFGKGKAVYIERIFRDRCANKKYLISLSESAKDAIIRAAAELYE